jgi:hypothetical protein
MTNATIIDATIIDQGTIVAIMPNTTAAKEWLRENCQTESWQWLGITLCVEPRYAADLVAGMKEADLTIE